MAILLKTIYYGELGVAEMEGSGREAKEEDSWQEARVGGFE